MRSIVPVGARFFGAAVLVASLLSLSARAASEKPLGVVVTADHARLDNASATIGADVFSGDSLVTQQGGSIRVAVGLSQIYLLSASSATLEPKANGVQAKLNVGAMGFSTSAPGQLQIQTPLAVIRGANSDPVFGQIVVMSASKMRVSSYKGTISVTDNAGNEKIIAPGESYEGTLAPANDDGPPPAGGGATTGGGINWTAIAKVAAILVPLGVLACALWPESDWQMGCWN